MRDFRLGPALARRRLEERSAGLALALARSGRPAGLPACAGPAAAWIDAAAHRELSVRAEQQARLRLAAAVRARAALEILERGYASRRALALRRRAERELDEANALARGAR